jgi:hypothetical protein
MASATDGERIVVYSASAGGMAAQQAASARVGLMGDVPGQDSVMAGGVYRTTLRPMDQRVYLPLMTREYQP